MSIRSTPKRTNPLTHDRTFRGFRCPETSHGGRCRIRTCVTFATDLQSDEVFRLAFLLGLKRRGLTGVRPVISDSIAGLVAPLKRSFQGAGHQRCRVHFARNLLALVPKTHTDMVAAIFRTIFGQPDAATVAGTVAATWDEVRDQVTSRFPRIGPLMQDAKAEVLAFTAFPRAHWPKVWSTNPLERQASCLDRQARN